MTTLDETRISRRQSAAKLALIAMLFSVLAPLTQAFAAELLPSQVVDPFRVICTAQGLSVLPDSGPDNPDAPELPETCAFCLVSSSAADSVTSPTLHIPAPFYSRSLASATKPMLGRSDGVERARAPPNSFPT